MKNFYRPLAGSFFTNKSETWIAWKKKKKKKKKTLRLWQIQEIETYCGQWKNVGLQRAQGETFYIVNKNKKV